MPCCNRPFVLSYQLAVDTCRRIKAARPGEPRKSLISSNGCVSSLFLFLRDELHESAENYSFSQRVSIYVATIPQGIKRTRWRVLFFLPWSRAILVKHPFGSCATVRRNRVALPLALYSRYFFFFSPISFRFSRDRSVGTHYNSWTKFVRSKVVCELASRLNRCGTIVLFVRVRYGSKGFKNVLEKGLSTSFPRYSPRFIARTFRIAAIYRFGRTTDNVYLLFDFNFLVNSLTRLRAI